MLRVSGARPSGGAFPLLQQIGQHLVNAPQPAGGEEGVDARNDLLDEAIRTGGAAGDQHLQRIAAVGE